MSSSLIAAEELKEILRATKNFQTKSSERPFVVQPAYVETMGISDVTELNDDEEDTKNESTLIQISSTPAFFFNVILFNVFFFYLI